VPVDWRIVSAAFGHGRAVSSGDQQAAVVEGGVRDHVFEDRSRHQSHRMLELTTR
jgi:hypothetical protein